MRGGFRGELKEKGKNRKAGKKERKREGEGKMKESEKIFQIETPKPEIRIENFGSLDVIESNDPKNNSIDEIKLEMKD